MYINKIKINKFRAYKSEFNLEFKKGVTLISGQNGIGKSTILALLVNSSELKSYKTIDNQPYRGDFKDIILFDSIADAAVLSSDTDEKPSSTISFSERPNDVNYPQEVTYRSTLQKRQINKVTYKKITDKSVDQRDLYIKEVTKAEEKRFRFIPHKDKNKTNEAKIEWPVLYLGMSRTYPTGEGKSAVKNTLPDNIQDDITQEYQEIMSLKLSPDANLKMENITLDKIFKNAGIVTNDYSSISNSSGQNDLSKILLAVKSFEKLSLDLAENYHGGLLAIDEVDVTLHPAAQNRLLDFLIKKSQELNLQIVCTTHSVTLLEHASYLNHYKKPVNISYLTADFSDDHVVSSISNPDVDFFRNNLSDIYVSNTLISEPVNVFTEDSVAQWFVKELMKFKDSSIGVNDFNFIDTDMDWQHLSKLAANGGQKFKNMIFLLDADVISDEKNYEKFKEITNLSPSGIEGENIFFIPGNDSIEKMMWCYIKTLPADDRFFTSPEMMRANRTKSNVIDHGPDSKEYENINKENVKLKKWFNNNRTFMTSLLQRWISDPKNEKNVIDFLNKLQAAYHRMKK